MLSNADLLAMRTAVQEAMPDSAQVRRKTLASDGAGGLIPTWEDVATIACRLAPIGRGDEVLLAGKPAEESVFVVTLPHDSNVQVEDRLVIGSRTFKVMSMQSRSWEIAKCVIVREDDDG